MLVDVGTLGTSVTVPLGVAGTILSPIFWHMVRVRF